MRLGSIPERLSRDRHNLGAASHIEVDQAAARRLGAGPLLERICPAHVYTQGPDGAIRINWAACLECGTCLALAPPGVLTWRYPAGGAGIAYRHG
ncbi:MAG: 4Fe-4S dicluster domain-containing protein [Bifidobacteriaceae bacterium]|jgi:ferredoxin like protein|nr:4Fe-4S dicluster domain-containing protein [Bifidobacteriaceae bacterium]